METAIWIIAILAVIVITIIYVITSVGKYSNSFIGKYFKDKDDPENKSIGKFNETENSDEIKKN